MSGPKPTEKAPWVKPRICRGTTAKHGQKTMEECSVSRPKEAGAAPNRMVMRSSRATRSATASAKICCLFHPTTKASARKTATGPDLWGRQVSKTRARATARGACRQRRGRPPGGGHQAEPKNTRFCTWRARRGPKHSAKRGIQRPRRQPEHQEPLATTPPGNHHAIATHLRPQKTWCNTAKKRPEAPTEQRPRQQNERLKNSRLFQPAISANLLLQPISPPTTNNSWRFKKSDFCHEHKPSKRASCRGSFFWVSC